MQVPIQRRTSRWETVHEGQWFTEVPLDVVSENIIITVESLHDQSFKEGFHEIEVYTGNSMCFFFKANSYICKILSPILVLHV